MHKALRVLAIIAVVAALVQVCDLVVAVIKPEEAGNESSTSFAHWARLRWIIYWPSGLASLIIGGFIRKKAALLANALLIGGVYLMLLGNNGGLWSMGHEVGRLATSIVTLAILIWIALRLDKPHQTSKSQEDQPWKESPAGNSEQV